MWGVPTLEEAQSACGAKQSAAFSNYAAGKTADEVANNAR